MRRSARGGVCAPDTIDMAGIEAWLLGDALAVSDLLELVESLAWRFVAAGILLDRFSVHFGTLHPQLVGFAWNWSRSDGLTDEVKVPAATLKSDGYLRSPLFRVIEHGETVRAFTADSATRERYPFLAELAGQGIAEYVAMPIGGGGYSNSVSLGTSRATGFSDGEFGDLRRALALFALHVERHIALRIAANVLDTYLGRAAGARVLKGAIHRGEGEAIASIVWVSDLRGFTDLSDRLQGHEVTAVLNAYFECLVGAIERHGGEVLKFIGDGLLAVFPVDPADGGKGAAEASLAAAQDALAAVERLNAKPPAALAGIPGWRPLCSGIALHQGDVFFGNVGAPERLDFTVIGRAVNEASRVEALTKVLGRPLLITQPVAMLLGSGLDGLGSHDLRGLARPMAIFAPSLSRS